MNDNGGDDGDEVVYYCQTFDFSTISGALFILIFILSVTVNSLLLCVLVLYEKLKNVTNLFILNLAFSDLMFTITLPFWAVSELHHWVFGDFACKFITAAYFAGTYSSVILLTAITVDRFMTVVLQNFPNNSVKRQRWAVGACAAAWVISIAASVSDAVKVNVETQWDDSYMCADFSEASEVKVAYFVQVSLLFFLPLAVIVFCYSAIVKTVLHAANRKKRRTVLVVLCIVLAFFICWGPYNIIMFTAFFYQPRGCYAIRHFDNAFYICRLLAYSHCCMNPLLYMLSQKLRGHLFKLLNCKSAWRQNRERGQSTSVNPIAAFTAQNSTVMLEITCK